MTRLVGAQYHAQFLYFSCIIAKLVVHSLGTPPGQRIKNREDLMAAGNWDLTQKIDRTTHFLVGPTGPLIPAPGEIVIRVEVWVMQQRTGAVQMLYQRNFPTPVLPATNPPTYNPWIWRADKPWYPASANLTRGLFRPGPALGTAVAIATDINGNNQTYYWWTQELDLEY
jgi:hypothetical protein